MKKYVPVLPFLTIPLWIPVYVLMDKLFLVDIFGCGCVPEVQTNMLSIAFNANDLRLAVFSSLTALLSVWSIFLSRRFSSRIVRTVYCTLVLLCNTLLTLWVCKTFLWL